MIGEGRVGEREDRAAVAGAVEVGPGRDAWGGEVVSCEVSAKQRIGIDELLEMILLQAEMLDLKATPDTITFTTPPSDPWP